MKFKKTLYGITAATVALSSFSATTVTPIAEDVQISGEGTSEVTPAEPTYIECDGIRYEVKGDSLSVSKLLDETLTEINIPAEIDGKPVTAIGNAAFGREISAVNYSHYTFDSKLEKITIPESVKSIGDYAFCGCVQLTSITIPDGVGTIGRAAFCACEKLESIDIPDSVYSIGMEAFIHSGLTEVTIPDGIKSIEMYTFYHCDNLTSVKISDGVESIGAYAFLFCSKLESVNIPDSVVTIGSSAFNYCGSLTSFTFPKNVKTIEQGVIQECANLTDVTIEGSNVVIGKNAFSNCKSLSNVKINGSVYLIGDSAFSYCTNLSELTIPNGIFSIGDEVFLGSSLTTVTIPESVRFIGKNLFDGTHGYNPTEGAVITRLPKIEKIVYGGTEEQWNELLEEGDWDGSVLTYNEESQKKERVFDTYTVQFNSDVPDNRTTDPELKVPTNVNWSRGDNRSVTIKWDEVEGATGYVFMYHSATYGWIAKKVSTNSITLSYLAAASRDGAGITGADKYYFKVAAINGDLIGEIASRSESGNPFRFEAYDPRLWASYSGTNSPIGEYPPDLDDLYTFKVDTSDETPDDTSEDTSSDTSEYTSDETSIPDSSEPEEVSSTPSTPTPPLTSSDSEINPDTSNPNDTNSEISSVPNTNSRPTSKPEEETGTYKPSDRQPANDDDINSLNSNTPESGSTSNPSTGATLALVPIVLASGAVVAATIKRKKK